MTPQLFVKLTQQIARQTPEAEALEALAASHQPDIDAAQALVDDWQASVATAQANLAQALTPPADAPSDWTPPDAAEQHGALDAATAALEAAKEALSQARAPQVQASAHAAQIRAQIAVCQAQMDASGMTMTQAEIDAVLNAPVVPQSVTMRQARLALLGAGKLAMVDAAIDSMPEPNKSAARIEWEYSNEVQRHNGFVEALGPALGMTSAQIDALFVAAAKL